MRFKRLMSIVLAISLVMSFAMTAFAGTLYYQKDFTEDTWYDAWVKSIYQSDSIAFNYNDQAASFDVDSWRAAVGNKSMIIGGRYLLNAPTASKYLEFRQSSNGDKHLVQIASTGQSYLLVFLPKTSWDATTENEAYIFSYDLESVGHDVVANPLTFGMLGKKDDGKAYMAKIASVFPHTWETGGITYFVFGNETMTYDDPLIEFPEANVEKRIAHKFVYDAENSVLSRMIGVDGKPGFKKLSTFDVADMKTVEAFATDLQNRNIGFGRIRAYTIDTAVGLVGEAEINGKTEVSTETRKVTIEFNQPVGAANVIVTADDKEVTGVTTEVREIISGNSISSEVDVIFPTDLSFETNYIIDISGVTNEVGDTCVSNDISFATTIPPKTTFTVSEGLTEGVHITNYAGKTVYVKATTVNNSLTTARGKIIIGIYDDKGNLVKYASVSKTIASNSSVTFGASFKLAAGQTINAKFQK